jgi:hypothetical protein
VIQTHSFFFAKEKVDAQSKRKAEVSQSDTSISQRPATFASKG